MKRKKIVIIVCFLFYGIMVGFATIWYDQHYDTPLYLNLSGYWVGEAFHGLWTRFISEIKPWILRVPQVYVLASVLFWGVIGTLFTVFLKPKVTAWIVGIYLVIFGTLTLLVEFF